MILRGTAHLALDVQVLGPRAEGRKKEGYSTVFYLLLTRLLRDCLLFTRLLRDTRGSETRLLRETRGSETDSASTRFDPQEVGGF